MQFEQSVCSVVVCHLFVSIVFSCEIRSHCRRVPKRLVAARLLWLPIVVGRPLYFAAVISIFRFSSFFSSSPNLSGRRLDVYHTSTRDVALVQIKNARQKSAARGSLKCRTQKSCTKIATCAPSHNFVGLYLRN